MSPMFRIDPCSPNIPPLPLKLRKPLKPLGFSLSPVGTSLHVFSEGWVGADGWNGEQILDPLQRSISGGFVGGNGRFGG